MIRKRSNIVQPKPVVVVDNCAVRRRFKRYRTGAYHSWTRVYQHGRIFSRTQLKLWNPDQGSCKHVSGLLSVCSDGVLMAYISLESAWLRRMVDPKRSKAGRDIVERVSSVAVVSGIVASFGRMHAQRLCHPLLACTGHLCFCASFRSTIDERRREETKAISKCGGSKFYPALRNSRLTQAVLKYGGPQQEFWRVHHWMEHGYRKLPTPGWTTWVCLAKHDWTRPAANSRPAVPVYLGYRPSPWVSMRSPSGKWQGIETITIKLYRTSSVVKCNTIADPIALLYNLL